MSNLPPVSVGHNRLDPIGDYFDDIALSRESDAAVARRCAPALQQALEIMCRFSTLKSRNDHDSMIFTTPEVDYESLQGNGGVLFMQATTPRYGVKATKAALQESRSDRTTCALRVRAYGPGSEVNNLTMLELTNHSIRRKSADGMRWAGHRELNYFMLVARRIGESIAKANTETVPA